MYKLYWSQGSGVMTPQALLEEAGADYEKIVVDIASNDHKSAEFLAVNPLGQIPALVLPDGTLMTESAAMVLQIADRHPEAKLAPPAASPESARFQRWLLFLATSLYTAALRYYYPDQFTSDPAGHGGISATGLADFDRCLAILDEALDPGPYLLGETFSAVDVYLTMLVGWHPEMPESLAANPRIRKLCELVEARPAIARVWAEHDEDA
ncbi:MAG: glutathione S-transferase family protein [Deltaproteobacteria bacterium]|nr:glutathione S-transferase family protein [Deltaproteobacteria bacterium]